MTTALIICAVSASVLASLLYNKSKEIATGEAGIYIGSRHSDEVIKHAWQAMVHAITHTSVREMRQFAFRMIIRFEKMIISKFEKLSSRFAVVGDIVTGRDIPKNRGSVSFFLKNIEAHKNLVQRTYSDSSTKEKSAFTK